MPPSTVTLPNIYRFLSSLHCLSEVSGDRPPWKRHLRLPGTTLTAQELPTPCARRERPCSCRAAEQRDELAPSFNHLVGTGDERRRHVQTDRLGCLQVDDELELHRPQDGQVGRPLAFENAAGVNAEQTLPIDNA
jgi:hypothetical protein